MGDPVPLLIVTGFLGAGKTSLLNRVLGAAQGRRIGVIINELGRIDIDTRLIKSRSGDVMELVGGCVCHEVRVQSELWAGVAEVVARSKPEVVILETTGIAEPWAILDGLDALPRRTAPVTAAGVVCVVDAESGVRQIERHEEARAQVEAADRILLSKLDLASADQVVAIHRLLALRNADAERAGFPATPEGTALLVPWLLDTEARPSSGRRRAGISDGAQPHAHDRQLVAAAFADDAPLLAEPLLQVCERLGPALVRAKGFVHVAGEPRRGFLERAGAHTTLTYGEAWGDERPRSEVVFIGEGFDEAMIQRQLWACRAGG
ncbi:MAG TPA: GTP-binding protein [Polyangia bacterium]|jgi:G3E family GTPase|nr:GTP-binding protein [Polyangia bacterium]